MSEGLVLRSSPLDAEHRDLDAKLVNFGGWNMPLAYPSGTLAEHNACRNAAVVFDVSHLGTVRVRGSKAFNTLQRAFTNDLSRVSPGRAQYTHLLDENDASVVDDIIVWWVDEQTFDVMPNASNTSAVLAATHGVDVTTDRAILAVQGPAARAAVHKISKEAAEVERFTVRRIDIDGVQCVVAGTGYTGEDGLEISIGASDAPWLWNALLDDGVLPAGLGARDTLRLEAGLPLHGHELGPGITPLQAGLGWVVSWDKGDFIGRGALLKEREAGIQRRMRCFKTDGRQPLREGSEILHDGEVVGVITSGNFSPTLGHAIAMGFVPPSITVGATVEVVVRGRSIAAKVVRLPFITKP